MSRLQKITLVSYVMALVFLVVHFMARGVSDDPFWYALLIGGLAHVMDAALQDWRKQFLTDVAGIAKTIGQEMRKP